MPDYDIMVDTALSWDGDFRLSWDGDFPPPDPEEDYEVEIGTVDGNRLVLVSSRYVGARDEADAASIALDAVCERYGYETDDDGKPIAVEIEGLRAPLRGRAQASARLWTGASPCVSHEKGRKPCAGTL